LPRRSPVTRPVKHDRRRSASVPSLRAAIVSSTPANCVLSRRAPTIAASGSNNPRPSAGPPSASKRARNRTSASSGRKVRMAARSQGSLPWRCARSTRAGMARWSRKPPRVSVNWSRTQHMLLVRAKEPITPIVHGLAESARASRTRFDGRAVRFQAKTHRPDANRLGQPRPADRPATAGAADPVNPIVDRPAGIVDAGP